MAHAAEDWLRRWSNSTAFACQPFVMALGSSQNPASRATCPGRDSVGGLAWLTPQLPISRATWWRKGALGAISPVGTSVIPPLRFSNSNSRSARSPSATMTTKRDAGPAKFAVTGSMPCTRGLVK